MLLELQNISKTYRTGVPIPVLRDVNFEIDEGEAAAILGPSGSGKSTLLNIIGGLTKPDSGSVHFNRRDLAALDSKVLAFFRNQEVGFVFQRHLLLPQMSLLENVLMPTLAFYHEDHASSLKERAIRLLTRVGLQDRQAHRPAQLSGGECQRAAVVRALINTPKLLLADEPTGSLDQKTAADMTRLLLDLNQEEKVTLVMVTHSLELADQIPQKYALVNNQLDRV